MKAIILFHYSVFDEEIRAMLTALGCTHFVEMPQA